MNWNQNRSIKLSQGCLIAFAVLLAAADLGGYWLTRWAVSISRTLHGAWDKALLMATLYTCSALAWALLFALWRLLRNMQRGVVFDEENVRYLRITGWCCFGACLICFFSSFYCQPILLIAIAAGFMGLIVRIVKNVFEQAITMKDELDLTV